MKVEVSIDLEELWNSIHYSEDKITFIKNHLSDVSDNDLIEHAGGIDGIINYLDDVDLSTTDKVKLRHAFKELLLN